MIQINGKTALRLISKILHIQMFGHLHDLKGHDFNFSGLLETLLSARTYMNRSADRCGKTLPKVNGGWAHKSSFPFKTQTVFYTNSGISWDLSSVSHLSVLQPLLHSKPLMPRLWSATWGACSWAPALGAAFTTPAPCQTRRAEHQPRASLWTAPRSPWRTVSDTSHALCRCKHVHLLVPHSAELCSLCCRLHSANCQLFEKLSRCHF